MKLARSESQKRSDFNQAVASIRKRLRRLNKQAQAMEETSNARDIWQAEQNLQRVEVALRRYEWK